MINEEVNEKFHSMGVLLILDVPKGFEFGIDNISWQVGDKFKGLKMIPLGTHMITYSQASQNHMFPVSKFLRFGVGLQERVLVFRWCPLNEKLMPLKGQQADGYRKGVVKYHFDCYLGVYPDTNISFWKTNTRHIREEVLDKLDPIEYYKNPNEEYGEKESKSKKQHQINIDEESDGEEVIEEQREEPQENQQKKVGRSKDFGGNIFYSDIPRRLKKQATHTSSVNLDKTEILEKVLKSQWPKNQFNILGQLQYSFVSFLLGQNLDSYNQWKHLILLLTNCQQGFKTKRELMLQFIVVLYEQIQQFPTDFFEDQIAKGNFLCSCFQKLKVYQEEQQIGKKAISRIQKLLEMVGKKFGYEINQDEEDQPVIVDENIKYY